MMSEEEAGRVAQRFMTSAAILTARMILKELGDARGDGPWLADLKAHVLQEAKNAEFGGVHPSTEPALYEAILTVVHIIFEDVRHTDLNTRRAD